MRSVMSVESMLNPALNYSVTPSSGKARSSLSCLPRSASSTKSYPSAYNTPDSSSYTSPLNSPDFNPSGNIDQLLQLQDRSSPGKARPSTLTEHHEVETGPNDYEPVDKASKSSQDPLGTECMNASCPYRADNEQGFRTRTCVLDHFGRNKAETREIKRTIVYCRRCYQHAAYRRNTWPMTKCDLVDKMLQLICVDEGCLPEEYAEIDFGDNHVHCSEHCDVRYTISMRASERNRLRILAEDFEDDMQAYIDGTDDEHAVMKKYKNEKQNKQTIDPKHESHSRWKRQSKSFIPAPLDVLKDFDELFCGRNKTRHECAMAVQWCRNKFQNDEVDDIPRFEFVIQCPRIENVLAERRAGKKGGKRSHVKDKVEKAAQDNAEQETVIAPSAGSAALTKLPAPISKKRKREDPEYYESISSNHTASPLAKRSRTKAVRTSRSDSPMKR